MATAPMSDDQRTTRFGSFLAGLSELISITPDAVSPSFYPHRDEADALYRDGVCIGDDMRTVIERERERGPTKER